MMLKLYPNIMCQNWIVTVFTVLSSGEKKDGFIENLNPRIQGTTQLPFHYKEEEESEDFFKYISVMEIQIIKS